jgi:hypothetical protein
MGNIFYHGTSYPALASIAKRGFRSWDTIWCVSDNSLTYLVKENEYEEGFSMAMDAAQIAAAYFGQTETKTVVFEFDVPEEVEEDYISDDVSCDHAQPDFFEVDSAVLNDLIREGQIGVKIHILEGAYNPSLRVFLLPVDNDYLGTDIDPLVMQAAGMVREAGLFLEDLYGMYDSDTVFAPAELHMTAWEPVQEAISA